MIRVKGKYVNQKLELERPLDVPEGTEIEVVLGLSDQDREREEWMQFGISRLEEEWDNSKDAIYDNWKKLYGL